MWIFVHPIHLVLSSVTVSNENFCCSLFLIQNHVVCVPAITAKRILFLNHRNRKVVGGKHKVLKHHLDVIVPDPAGMVVCNPFKWDILLFILIENLVFCAWNNYKTNFIPQPQEQKSGRRQTQCSSTLCEYLCTWSSWCCPLQPLHMRYYFAVHFWSKIFLFLCTCHNGVMNFIPQPQKKKSFRMPTKCSSILCGC